MINLIFYNNDLSAWTDYVIAVDWLKIERQQGFDELQIVASDSGLEFRLMDVYCCHAIEPSGMSMWIIDKSTIKMDDTDGQKLVSFTLYEPLWALTKRVTERHLYSQSLLLDFTTTSITENTAGDKSLGATFDLSALSSLPATYQVTRNVDGEYLGDMLEEEYRDRDMKLYMTMSIANGLAFTAGIQSPIVLDDVMLAPLLQNMQVNLVSTGNDFGAVYVSGEYTAEGAEPLPLRGYYTLGVTGVEREEHFTQSNKSSDGMTQEEYQAYLDAEAQRIAKRRTLDIDISTIAEVMESITPTGRFNRAGAVLPANIDRRLIRYMIDEVKTTPNGTSIGVSEYKG